MTGSSDGRSGAGFLFKGCNMGNMSIWHWLVVLIFYVIGIMIPVGKVLSKAGRSPIWCVFAIVPVLNIILLWVFAFSSWPSQRK